MHRNKDCNVCGKETYYNEEYDVYYCVFCNEWKEQKCGDSECEFCSNRPLFPSQTKEMKEVANNLFTLQEVAIELRVSNQTIYNMIKSKRIKAVKIGREYRITDEEVNRIKEGR